MGVMLQIKLMGTRDNAANHDFSSIPLEEEEESHLKDAAVISMGTEISGEDMLNIEALCDQVHPCALSSLLHIMLQSPKRTLQP